MKKMLPYFKGSRLQCLLAPLFKMFEAILELIIPIIVAEIIDNGIALSDKNYTVRLSVQMILLGLIGFTFSITAQYFSAFAAINTVKNIKNSLYEKVLNLEISQFEQVGNDNIVTRLTTDMDSIQNGINLTLRLLLRSPFVVFGACIMAFRVSHKSIVIYFSVVLFLSVIIISVMRSSIRLNKISRNKLDSVYTSVKDYLKGTRVIRAFGIDNKIQKEFFERNSVLTSSSIITGNINSLLNPLTTVVVNLGIIAVLKFGSENVINGTLSTGAVVALYNYMTQILTELVKFANLITTISKSTACAKRVSGLFDMKNSKNNSESSSGSEHYIEFRNVNFKYPGASEECLKNISFVAERGNKIGIVGSTGSGKSTLIQLLNGTYTPTSGQIFINGHSTTSSEFSEYKKQIATVEQKPYIFAGTIESNIDINGTIPDENRIISSLRTAEAFDFVSEYSDVIKHSINHNGNNLSGGQKQRIAIARAIAVNPEILILDDSGSSLDYYTDLKIRNAINNSEIKTVFSVSQKTASVKNSDLIIVLEDGTAEYGTHDELLKKSSVYKEIHLSQSEEENV